MSLGYGYMSRKFGESDLNYQRRLDRQHARVNDEIRRAQRESESESAFDESAALELAAMYEQQAAILAAAKARRDVERDVELQELARRGYHVTAGNGTGDKAFESATRKAARKALKAERKAAEKRAAEQTRDAQRRAARLGYLTEQAARRALA